MNCDLSISLVEILQINGNKAHIAFGTFKLERLKFVVGPAWLSNCLTSLIQLKPLVTALLLVTY